jgi:hypothetical protein
VHPVLVTPLVRGAWKVTSQVSDGFHLEVQNDFKASQFLRTLLYESLPPGPNYVACLLTETLVFGRGVATRPLFSST